MERVSLGLLVLGVKEAHQGRLDGLAAGVTVSGEQDKSRLING